MAASSSLNCVSDASSSPPVLAVVPSPSSGPAPSGINNNNDNNNNNNNYEEENSICDNGNRMYIDPWDMENYVYLKRSPCSSNTDEYSDPVVSLSTAGGLESAYSDFYYIPFTHIQGHHPEEKKRQSVIMPLHESINDRQRISEKYPIQDFMEDREFLYYCRQMTPAAAAAVEYKSFSGGPYRRNSAIRNQFDNEVFGEGWQHLKCENSFLEECCNNKNNNRPSYLYLHNNAKIENSDIRINRLRSLFHNNTNASNFDGEYDYFGKSGIIRSDDSAASIIGQRKYDRLPPENEHGRQYGHLKIDYSSNWINLGKYIRQS